MDLELRLLGPVYGVAAGQQLENLRSRNAQALLVYLVTDAAFSAKPRPHAHRREQLMALLWPGAAQQPAQASLRQSLYQLRRFIPTVASRSGKSPVPLLLADRATIQLNPDADYHLDVASFLHLLRKQPLPPEPNAQEPAPDRLQQAVALYRGSFLADFSLPDSELFEEWAGARRATLQRLALDALGALGRHHLARGEGARAESYARRQLELDEFWETGHQQLIQVLAQSGRRTAALAHYESYQGLLERELGVAPSGAAQALVDGIRSGRDAHQPAIPRGVYRLPSPATPFVGRRVEMAAITGQLADGCRLLTLLGPGGVGKTRLSIEAARRLADDCRHGTLFVSLTALADPADIPGAVVAALGFHLHGEASAKTQVIHYLADKALLLVLDNFEHLLEGAQLVVEMLEGAPEVKIMITSRVRLGLVAECIYDVGSLRLPKAIHEETFEEVEAVALFLARASRVRAGFRLDEGDRPALMRICHLTAGVPLALELAASWVRHLPLTAIAGELAADLDTLASEHHDLPERQRSMRASFNHSWHHLDEMARDALMKLSVFTGGASREAAGAVTGASMHALASLVDHSLLRHDPLLGRYAVHELIRGFAHEQLEATGRADAVRAAHSDYYLQVLADRLPHLKGRDQLAALDAIEADFENVRAAWRWAAAHGRCQLFAEAGQSLYLFAFMRSRYHDGVQLFQGAWRELTAGTTPAERLARAYGAAGWHALLSHAGLREEANERVSELRSILDALTDPAAAAYCRMMMGQIFVYSRRYDEAVEQLHAARSYYESFDEPFYTAVTLWRLGLAYGYSGRLPEATRATEEGLRLGRAVGDHFVCAALSHNLGGMLEDSPESWEAAEGYFREAARLLRETGERARYAIALLGVAKFPLWRDGDLMKARALLEEAWAVATEQNVPFVRAVVLNRLATHRLVEGRYEEALELTEEALELGDSGGDPSSRSLIMLQRGIAFLALGKAAEATRLMRQGLAHIVRYRWTGLTTIFLPFFAPLLTERGEHVCAAELLAYGLTEPRTRGLLAHDPLILCCRAELETILGEARFAAAWERGAELDAPAVAVEVLERIAEPVEAEPPGACTSPSR